MWGRDGLFLSKCLHVYVCVCVSTCKWIQIQRFIHPLLCSPSLFPSLLLEQIHTHTHMHYYITLKSLPHLLSLFLSRSFIHFLFISRFNFNLTWIHSAVLGSTWRRPLKPEFRSADGHAVRRWPSKALRLIIRQQNEFLPLIWAQFSWKLPLQWYSWCLCSYINRSLRLTSAVTLFPWFLLECK